jgi:hypothetical protein
MSNDNPPSAAEARANELETALRTAKARAEALEKDRDYWKVKYHSIRGLDKLTNGPKSQIP